MSSATEMGINIVFQFILAARAVVITGAMSRATTAGRIPMKILLIVSLFFIVSGVRKIAMSRIIVKEGIIVPRAAHSRPREPRSLSPMATAKFTARMPGRDCATASKSRKSSRDIHLCLLTTSRSIMEIITHPPPNVNAPIFRNVKNNCR